MTNQPSFQSQLDAIAKLFNDQPEDVRELFQYALVMLMVEDNKAEIVARQSIDNLEYLTVKTIAGDVFEIVKPQMCEDLLATLRALAREVLNQDRASDADS
ncbi:hypothetical protein ANRL3_02075 [Anaerolineae bacterium]|nr:hypothetical protein ANRL3_02075 [Anaerolineae bacterium]